MGYTGGAKILADIIDEIANGLIATPGGYWTNADTTWNTTDKTGNNARRALKYLNGTEEIYLALEAINTSTQIRYYTSGSNYCRSQGKGLRVTFSASWDSVNHTYPASNQQSFISFEIRDYIARYNDATNNPVAADLATLQITYYLWIDASGFVITAKPEPNSTDAVQQSFFLVVERVASKEYSDGYSNFYMHAWMNIYQPGSDSYLSAAFRSILRPFAYAYPSMSAGFGNYDNLTQNGMGISYVPTPVYYAFKSTGNGKVYYVKPIINNSNNQLNPIFQAELWFPWSEGVGLIDGDVIAIEGQTTKFLCKALDCPDSVNRLPFAIKYVA